MKKPLILVATAGSAALMLGALAFQYIGEMPPCKMCYWQRYGHITAIGLGVLAFFLPVNALILLALLAVLSSAVIGGFHAGVEQGWWEGPTTCTSGPIGGLSTDDLLNQIMSAPLVRCDEIPWEMFGISMAGWNMIVSLGIVAIWSLALWQPR
jgi:disulfide bond formation protein DsbB